MSLPDGYTRLEYIESSGAQYIETGFYPTGNTRLVMDVEITDGSTDNQWLYGGGAGVKSSAFGFFWYKANFGVSFGNSQNTAILAKSDPTERICIDHNTNTIAFCGVEYTFTTATFTSPSTLVLFARQMAGALGGYSSAKLYSCQIYDNGTLIRDFVPCKNASGVVGLYDAANGAFYTDAAGGTFTAGAEILSSLKLIDSANLDAALTATADAIRTKTGETGQIPLVETNGFANAVSAISNGAKIVSGSFTLSSAQNLRDSSYTVSGIGFEPAKVIVYLAGDRASHTNHYFVCAEFGERNVCTGSNKASGTYYLNDYTDTPICTMNSDGFTLSANSSFSLYAETYNYIAIG